MKRLNYGFKQVSARTHTARLLKLAKLVERTPKKRFNMGTWGAHAGKHHPTEENYCGTQACALGTASFDPAFRRAGLKSEWVKRFEAIDGTERWKLVFPGSQTGEIHQWGGAFFGLSYDESGTLFLGLAMKKKQVANLARRYAANREELKRK